MPQVKKRRIVQFPENLDKPGQIPDSEIALTWRNVSLIVTILGDGKLKLLHIILILSCNCGASQDRFIAMVLSSNALKANMIWAKKPG